jgi:hypothetical protein
MLLTPHFFSNQRTHVSSLPLIVSHRLVMFTITHVLLALAAAAVVAAAAAPPPPPALKFTLSQSCITYGKDWAISKFLPSLQKLRAPDVHGSTGNLTLNPCTHV